MTRRDLALSLLRDAGPRGVETGEFLRAGVGSRYGARLLELRKQGHRIESERIREGSWRYVLSEAGEGAESLTQLEDAIDPLSGGALFAFPDAYEELRAKDVA